ncbi:hypothetical protein Cflav_PD3443 [Pedosphaera parvula Ellin514]|uniref:Uncharacterized protein n=1 Tax=Pedosphaera parvula (strain Ellin514) TaxID=320771 RepID=B9XHY0_PEDPL|nr:hypothetical protein Cflav_PD3443 [Pedosphaera parvula Ellin514]
MIQLKLNNGILAIVWKHSSWPILNSAFRRKHVNFLAKSAFYDLAHNLHQASHVSYQQLKITSRIC